MNTLLLLAQDSITSPWEKYFSFIVLGLLMTIGYVVLRLQKKPKRDQESAGLEASLRDAEREVLLSLPPKRTPSHPNKPSEERAESQESIDPLDDREEGSSRDSNESQETEKKELGEEKRD